MALPIVLILAATAGGAYLLLQPGKKPGAGPGGVAAGPGQNPVIVPPAALPTPPGAPAPSDMPGGPPTVLITPPAASASQAQTPQQILTQLPSLLAQMQPTAAASTSPGIKEVPAPGQSSIPAASSPTAQTPQEIFTQALPQAVQQVLTQAGASVPMATPVQQTETMPQLDPNGTIVLAKMLIDREAAANWKTANQPEIKIWQTKTGLTADGKFGEKSALRMAQEVGVLPLIRYWPASTQKGTEVPKFQAALRAYAATVAPTNPAHAAALTNSAAFEVGYSYAATPAAIPISLRSGQADLLLQILKQ